MHVLHCPHSSVYCTYDLHTLLPILQHVSLSAPALFPFGRNHVLGAFQNALAAERRLSQATQALSSSLVKLVLHYCVGETATDLRLQLLLALHAFPA